MMWSSVVRSIVQTSVTRTAVWRRSKSICSNALSLIMITAFVIASQRAAEASDFVDDLLSGKPEPVTTPKDFYVLSGRKPVARGTYGFSGSIGRVAKHQ